MLFFYDLYKIMTHMIILVSTNIITSKLYVLNTIIRIYHNNNEIEIL